LTNVCQRHYGTSMTKPRIRPTRAELDLQALRSNVALLQKHSGSAELLAVVKANAYGHGVNWVAPALEAAGIRLMGVALVEEALELRALGIQTPILVLGLGGTYDGAWDILCENRLWPTIYRPDQVRDLAAVARRRNERVKAHVKIDTGMGRLGAQAHELDALLDAFDAHPELILDGLSSHFANADLADRGVTQAQVERFRAALARVRQRKHEPTYRHLPGLALYGLSPAAWIPDSSALRPVLQWKTAIAHLKSVAEGTAISYGGTWVARRPSKIATLPVGYADGYSRHHSNLAHVLVRGHRAAIAGRVCMDMCMIDVTDVPDASVGDEVVLLGTQGSERVSADDLAAWSHTIHYEVVCGIGHRVPRVVAA
jgi:alanine racemase